MSSISAIAQIINKHEADIVRKLATKYGFDPVDAAASLARDDSPSTDKLIIDDKKAAAADKKAAAAEKKAAREAKKAAKAEKPKRPTTGYLLFCKHERIDLNLNMPCATPQEKIKELARRWKELLTEEERVDWNSMAKTADVSDDNENDNLEIEDNSE
jgi:pyruvate/2-oxoglutarate dehydrogenase complex dihydrolipoamide acyltransferase (E2) component